MEYELDTCIEVKKDDHPDICGRMSQICFSLLLGLYSRCWNGGHVVATLEMKYAIWSTFDEELVESYAKGNSFEEAGPVHL